MIVSDRVYPEFHNIFYLFFNQGFIFLQDLDSKALISFLANKMHGEAFGSVCYEEFNHLLGVL